MKSAKQFASEVDQARGVDILGMVVARDAEVRAFALREAAKLVRWRGHDLIAAEDLEAMSDRTERGDS